MRQFDIDSDEFCACEISCDGIPSVSMNETDRLLLFFKKIDTGENCWLWLGAKNQAGYGLFRTSRRLEKAHRVSYETFVGPIPGDLVIDHLCRNRGCVRPDHLEPVTIGENIRRGEPANRTHCKNGHHFNEENTCHPRPGSKDQGRKCRVCNRERMRKNYVPR